MTSFKETFKTASLPINNDKTLQEWSCHGPAIVMHHQRLTLPNVNSWVNTLHVYDFSTRLLTSSNITNTVDTISVTPFSQLDLESLNEIRNKLIEMGGSPPALPAPATPAGPVRERQLTTPAKMIDI